MNARRFGDAWLALTLAVAAHVVDEALTGFLSFYNPAVRALRVRYAWFPMPVFGFKDWLTGLIFGLAALSLLAVPAYAGSRAVRIAAYPFAFLMCINGIAHLAGSAYLGHWLPGATTAPLLIGAAVWLFRQA